MSNEGIPLPESDSDEEIKVIGTVFPCTSSSVKNGETSTSGRRLRKRKSDNASQAEPRGKRKEKIAKKDDKTSMTKLMAEEIKKPNPNLMFLAKGMEKTFQARWKTISRGEKDVKAIVAKYPALMNYKIVKEEYNSVLDKHDKMESLEKALGGMLKSALKLKEHAYPHPTVDAAREKYTTHPDCDKTLEQVLGMIVLAFHLARENVEKSLCRFLDEDETLDESEVARFVTPTLVLKRSDMFSTESGDCWIYVEGEKFLQVPNFYEGVVCMHAIYYIFNLSYDPKLADLFEFIDMLNGNKQSTFAKTQPLYESRQLQ